MADSSSVSDVIRMLDATHVAEQEAARRRREEERIEYEKQQKLLAEQEKIWKAEEEKRKEEAAKAERERWRVDEDEAAKEVARLKKEFREKVEPKSRPKSVHIKEIPTLVIDIGSNTIKVGYAGEEVPVVMVSSVAGHVRGEHFMDLDRHAHVDKDAYYGDEVWALKDVLTIKRIVKKGVIQDWKDFEELLSQILFEELKLPKDLSEYPVLLTEPPFTPRKQREKLMTLMFDKYNVAAVYVSNTATLSMFSTGTVTGIVVQVGYEVATSVAVFEGEVVPNSLKRLDLAGYELDLYLIRLLNQRGYRFNELSILDNFIARDIKEQLCEVASDEAEYAEAIREAPPEPYDVSSNGNDLLPGFDKKTYPDTLQIGSERFMCPEALFDPRAYLGKDLAVAGIQKMVEETVAAVSIDLKRPLYKNVVLAGGTTLLTGFAERLRTELKLIVPQSVEVNIRSPNQRHVAAWAGGSVLASAKSFNFHWVSREEYDEYGLELAHHA
eukprot:m.33961 g.33961  ORF g.33961 m.33961 type:complete len:497 (+) comp8641_c0_seq2:117-1607(+)